MLPPREQERRADFRPREGEELFGLRLSLAALCTEVLAAGRIPHDTLRPRLRAIVTAGRSAGLYPEALLRLMKESWWAAPVDWASGSRQLRQEELDRLVTICIEEFFHEPRDGDGA